VIDVMWTWEMSENKVDFMLYTPKLDSHCGYAHA